MQSFIQCSNCLHESSVIEAFNDLSLSLISESSSSNLVTLEDSLSHFTSSEMLNELVVNIYIINLLF